MRGPLPKFLNFLKPLLNGLRVGTSDPLTMIGHVRIEARRDGVLVDVPYDGKNYIVTDGISAARDVLIGTNGGGFAGSIFRMAIGDGGAPPGDLFNPKLPDATWDARTGLFHEVIRQDISTFTRPTASSMRFVAAFSSPDVDTTSYSVADKVINEAALIIGDGALTMGLDKKQINKAPPDTADADEKMFSMRTFKSTPFDNLQSITITVTWTISLAR